jgi:DNA-binding Lrp family transcriptional regulator
MGKNSLKQIEQDEKKIIEKLSKKANKSINDIAKSCHFSRQKVWRIIKNMEKNNTIWGYTAVINPEKLNKKRYVMLLKKTNRPVSKEIINQIISREIANKVKKWGIEFINSAYMNGKYDYIISFYANNIKDAKNVEELYYRLYPGLISEIDMHEEIFTVQRCGINNPEINKFRDFFEV